MNKYIGIGRLTRDPQIIAPSTPEGKTTAKYTIAIDRKYRNQSDENADFIPCVAFGASADFAEKYLHQGIKIAVNGRIQTGSYTNKDGIKIPTFNLIIEEQEFVESKAANENIGQSRPTPSPSDAGYMNIPEGADERLPFN